VNATTTYAPNEEDKIYERCCSDDCCEISWFLVLISFIYGALKLFNLYQSHYISAALKTRRHWSNTKQYNPKSRMVIQLTKMPMSVQLDPLIIILDHACNSLK
jgi:hypothetical protein